MLNNVVLHFQDGMVRKGTTDDFFPNKPTFHFNDLDAGAAKLIPVNTLKAVFFVKSYTGNPEYEERDDLDRAGFGKRIRVRFRDGETQEGYTQGFSPERQGFFVFPCDPSSNNDRIFVVSAATDEVAFV